MSSLAIKISKNIPLSIESISRVIKTAPYRYKEYEISKRNGRGTRTIAQPAREVKMLQYWVIRKVLRKLPVHDCCVGYMKGLGIKENASRHIGSRYLLKMDFKNFFPSIKDDDFVKHMKNYSKGFTDQDFYWLSRILFYKQGKKNVLSIGAPSSPLLSNTIMYDFDRMMNEICIKFDVTYTRYADDLTFSTNVENALFNIEKEVDKILKKITYPRLKINKEKTIHTSKAHSRRVTGVVLSSDDSISIGRERKRYIKGLVHRYSVGSLDDVELVKLKGYLAFAYDIEPEFIDRLRNKYTDEVISALINKI